MQNFVDSLGHDSQVWSQVKSINQVNLQGNGRQGDVEFTVSNRNAFENALVNTQDTNGYYRFTNVENAQKALIHEDDFHDRYSVWPSWLLWQSR